MVRAETPAAPAAPKKAEIGPKRGSMVSQGCAEGQLQRRMVLCEGGAALVRPLMLHLPCMTSSNGIGEDPAP